MKKDLKNKRMLITGAAQGIGKGMTGYFLSAGIDVIALDNDMEALDELKSGFPSVQAVLCDLSNEKEIMHVTDEHCKAGLWALVNNAAVASNKSVQELSLEEWNQVLAVNLTAPMLLSKYCFPYLKESGGSIVNIASTRALMSEKNTEAYSASKGGILALTHALAISFVPRVRVNAISPGWIEVGDLKKSRVRKPVILTDADHLQHPAGRVGKFEDIARTVEFLIDEKAEFITGQNFIIDGGMTRKMIYT